MLSTISTTPCITQTTSSRTSSSCCRTHETDRRQVRRAATLATLATVKLEIAIHRRALDDLLARQVKPLPRLAVHLVRLLEVVTQTPAGRSFSRLAWPRRSTWVATPPQRGRATLPGPQPHGERASTVAGHSVSASSAKNQKTAKNKNSAKNAKMCIIVLSHSPRGPIACLTFRSLHTTS